MIPPLYRLLEVAIYSLLNFFPFMLLALYPFQKSRRFSRTGTWLLIAAILLIQIAIGCLAAFSQHSRSSLSTLSTVLYAAFFFMAIKAHPGKILFTLIMFSNIANFVVTAAKCMEGIFFPTLAVENYRWSFSLFMVLIELLFLIPLFFFIKKTYMLAFEQQVASPIWWCFWLVPATFYIVWNKNLYFSATSPLEAALDIGNSIFLLIINLCAILVYYLFVLLIMQTDKNNQLTQQNHQLTMQSLQYGHLQERINEARRAKHDIRHHITVMDTYLSTGEYDKLKLYLKSYKRSLPDDSAIVFCQHPATNVLLLYFAQQAKDNQIDYDVLAEVPQSLKLPEDVLSVVLGNLLENAVEACLTVNDRPRSILIRMKTSHNSLFIAIENTYSGKLNQDKQGHFLSTKHAGRGLGLTSVEHIIQQYDGMLEIEPTEESFRVSLLISIPEAV